MKTLDQLTVELTLEVCKQIELEAKTDLAFASPPLLAKLSPDDRLAVTEALIQYASTGANRAIQYLRRNGNL